MSKVIEKNAAEILVLIVLVFVMSSCGTIREMTMSDHTMRTKCNWVNVSR